MINRIICFSRFRLCFQTYVRYIFPFSAYKTFRTNFGLFLSSPFLSLYLDVSLVFQFDFFFQFLQNLMQAVTAYWKHLSPLLLWFIVASLLFIQSRESIYALTQFRFIFFEEAPFFVTFSMQKVNVIKDKIITFYWYF